MTWATGVSNTILDKPASWTKKNGRRCRPMPRTRGHSVARQCLLGTRPRAAAHPTLDGKGYPPGCAAGESSLETRIITVADVFDAITAARPYRDAVPVPRTLEIMAENVGSAIDADCFAALRRVVEQMERAQGSSEQL